MSNISDYLNMNCACKKTACSPYPDAIDAPKSSQEKDMVSHPTHYQVKDMTYEPIKVINAWELNFNIGSAVKYLARYKKKFNAIEDLKKAIFYIQDEINHLEQQKKEEKTI